MDFSVFGVNFGSNGTFMKAACSLKNIFQIVIGMTFLLALITCSKGEDENQLEWGTVTDIDGNVYKTVKIGNQWWMAENLKVTKYRNGDSIPNVLDSTQWEKLSIGSYWWYDNDMAYKTVFGALYNWFAVNDSRNIAPPGWHIATENDWCQMMKYLDTSYYCDGLGMTGCNIGSKLKAKSSYWHNSRGYETNETGFSSLPGGYRWYTGYFFNAYAIGFWWSANDNDSIDAWYRDMSYYYPCVFRSSQDKRAACSVRCVED